MTLLVDLDEHIVVVMDPSNGFWFLPGGGAEHDESVEETAKREATEELGLEIEVDDVIGTFEVILISTIKRERVEIPPYIVVRAKPVKGRLRSEYARKRKIVLINKKDCRSLLESSRVPDEYECFRPHHRVSKEVVQQFVVS